MRRLFYIISIMASFVMLFMLAKPAFMLYNGAIGQGAEMSDFLEVIWHGLPLDLCVAACATLPFLLISLFPRFSRRFAHVVAVVIALAAMLALVADTCLYEFWDIKLDATVLAYLDSPRGVTSSVSATFLLGVTVAIALLTFLFGWWLCLLTDRLRRAPGFDALSPAMRGNAAGGYVLLLAVMVLCIRGIHRLWADAAHDEPLSVAAVYYSPRQLFNHSAVNPVFSFLTSVGQRAQGISPDTFMDDAEAARLFATLHYNTQSIIAPGDSLLTTSFVSSLQADSAVQVVVIILEGCGGSIVSEVCGKMPDLTPCLNRLCREGVFFDQCYANSFRTDRGVLCALSGYPAFPDVSVMRQSGQVARLSGIARHFPHNDFLYGGDRDFTNMARYLRATGYSHVWGDVDFPESERRTHDWGVTDSITFATLQRLTLSAPEGGARFTTFLTLASHEPWEVPYTAMRRKGKIGNSFAYLDHCLGKYVEALKASSMWQRTLLVLLPDHGIAWPDGMTEHNIDRQHIPMIWTGGAIRRARRITTICNQTDLPATLLGQLGMRHDDFPFSRDVLSQTYTVPCAQHAWAEGFSIVDATGYTIIDLHTLQPVADVNTAASRGITLPLREAAAQKRLRAQRAKAFLQMAYRHLEGGR